MFAHVRITDLNKKKVNFNELGKELILQFITNIRMIILLRFMDLTGGDGATNCI